MSTLADIVGYIYKNYPNKEELSKGRLTKLIFLSDWLMCVTQQRQISPIHWYFNQYGPYVDEIDELLKSNPLFTLKDTNNYYGGNKKYFFLKDEMEFQDHLTDEERSIINNVIHKTQGLSWDEFRKIVYNTYPLSAEIKYKSIDLVSMAKTYRQSLVKTTPAS